MALGSSRLSKHAPSCSVFSVDIWGHAKVKAITVSDFEKWQLLSIGILFTQELLLLWHL